MGTRVGIYARSAAGGVAAIERQFVECRRFVAARGWEVIAEYDDSGTQTAGRERMLEDVDRCAVDVVLAWDLDRFGRRVDDLARIVETAARADVGIATASGDVASDGVAWLACQARSR